MKRKGVVVSLGLQGRQTVLAMTFSQQAAGTAWAT
jgi:hypothetical protein